MEKFIENIENYLFSPSPYLSIFTILLNLIIVRKLKSILKAYIRNGDYTIQQEHNMILAYNIFRLIFFIISMFFVLQLHGINVTSLISTLGVVGVIVGLALQDILKDWFAGINMILNHHLVIGDVVKINGYTGKILNLDFFIVRIREMYTDNLVTISNRMVSTVEVLTNIIFYNVPFPYEIDSKSMMYMIEQMVNEMRKIEGVNLCCYDGTAQFLDSSINQRIRVEIDDKMRLPKITRCLNDVVLQVYEESAWSIPYNHMVVDLEKN